MSKNKEIVTHIYPMIEKSIQKNMSSYKKVLSLFFESRHEFLYDTCPCDRIYFGQDDLDKYYNALKINEKDITNHLSKTYYYPMANFNPKAAKDEFTVAQLMVIRYFFLKNKRKETELATLYLAFSGKFYPSIHYGFFQKVQPSEHRYVMEYVINQLLTNKFDLKTEQNLINAIKSKCITWLDKYKYRIKRCDDEDVVYLIQQLHNRIKSFMKNIANLYYETYKNKDQYFTYDSDNLDEDNYHIADNDSLKIERAVEKTMSNINANSVDYQTCKTIADKNVKTDEIKNIVESILSDSDNMDIIKELLRTIITQYYIENRNADDLRDVRFLSKSMAPRPNSKEKNILRQREIIEELLTENSSAYNRRKSRYSTKSSYQKSLLYYFVLTIFNSNK